MAKVSGKKKKKPPLHSGLLCHLRAKHYLSNAKITEMKFWQVPQNCCHGSLLW